MGAPARTRALSAQMYLTDGERLIFVLDLPEGQAVIEDVATGEVSCVPSVKLEGWRVVEPAGDGA